MTAFLCGCSQSSLPAAKTAGTTATRAQLHVQEDPLRLSLVAADHRTVWSTLPGQPGSLPTPVTAADASSPSYAATESTTYAPFGWIVGVRRQAQIPASFFQGNQLFSLDTGVFIAATRVDSRQLLPGGDLQLRLATNAGAAAGDATLTLHRRDDGSLAMTLEPPAGLGAVVATLFSIASPPGEGLYGLGARKDAFDQRGLMRNVWTEQQNTGPGPFEGLSDPVFGPKYTFPNGAQAAYFVNAALFGSRGWGAWITQTALSRLDLAVGRPDAVRWLVQSPALTLLVDGDGLAAASRAYTAFYGRAPAPPRYVYQPWIDVINQGEGEAAPLGAGFTGGARVKADVQTVVQQAQQLNLPIGVIGMEGWQAVPGIADFAASLRTQGYHLSGYWNFFIAKTQQPDTPGHDAAYAEAENQGLFVHDVAGGDYPVVSNRGGSDLILDFSNLGLPAFWYQQLKRMFDLGFEAFMEDFGELTSQGMVFANGAPIDTEHNAFPVQYHDAGRAAADRYAAAHPGFQPFFYVRAGYNGVCADTPGVFPGDETTDFNPGSGLPSVIPAMLNLTLTGCYAFTTDVGGYLDLLSPQTSKELFIRWSQLAAFTPILRIHDSTYHHSVYPWSFDRQTEDIFRRYARAKIKLIPLVDAWAQRAARDGAIGPVRPLVLDDPSPQARAVDDEWLLGDTLLVAPVISQGAASRSVYFPGGSDWAQVVPDDNGELVPTGAVYPGGSRSNIPVTLADIPLFQRR